MAVAELAVAGAPAGPGVPAAVIARRTARAAARSGVLWGCVFGAFTATSAWSYTTIYKTQAERDALAAAFGANKATIALFGPAPELQTVGGFTVFKVSMTSMIIGAIWGVLTATRLLRGEEDAGRWELLLTGRAAARGATAQALVGLGAGAAALWAVTAAIAAVVGLSSRVDIAAGPACYLALALVSTAVVFLAVGALTSQLAPTRRQAAGYAAVVLGVSYGLRMVGDAGIGLHWLTWL
ncbi:MAG TPA: ABC transporter permease subunit, partial [Acidimicrobiales bacterium]|nr:ABC transporter permease subunit [Acidimicrobiales bacterium]